MATEPSLSRRVARALKPFEKLSVSMGDEDTYRRFRVLEQSLVSCADDFQDGDGTVIEYPAITCLGEIVGVTSIVTRVNVQKPPARSLYGRVDLVIVNERFRGLGLGRVLTLVGVAHLLETHDSRMYSISCLAAHPAMEKILNSIGFVSRDQPDKNYVHEELVIEPSKVHDLTNWMVSQTKQAARRANFSIRQRQNEG